jgi:hypothetical protein
MKTVSLLTRSGFDEDPLSGKRSVSIGECDNLIRALGIAKNRNDSISAVVAGDAVLQHQIHWALDLAPSHEITMKPDRDFHQHLHPITPSAPTRQQLTRSGGYCDPKYVLDSSSGWEVSQAMATDSFMAQRAEVFKAAVDARI